MTPARSRNVTRAPTILSLDESVTLPSTRPRPAALATDARLRMNMNAKAKAIERRLYGKLVGKSLNMKLSFPRKSYSLQIAARVPDLALFEIAYADAFPPLEAVALELVSLRITVAGQWRIRTAFPATAIQIYLQTAELISYKRDPRRAARRIRVNYQVRFKRFSQ